MKKNKAWSKIKNFMKKNMYYVLLFVCIAAVGTMITVTVLNSAEPDISIEAPEDENKKPDIQTPEDEIPTPENPDTQKPEDEKPDQTPEDKPGSSDTDTNEPVVTPPDTDVVTKPIVFGLPVEGSVLCAYSDSELVYCTTLKQWQTHSGIDYACVEGSEVKAVYGGVVESVTTDSLNGTVVTINHGNGLVTKYGSLESASVTEGTEVELGTVIGVAGNSALKEVNLGTHLHFEALLDGKSVNPAVYSGENK